MQKELFGQSNGLSTFIQKGIRWQESRLETVKLKRIFESIDGKFLTKKEALKGEVQLKPKENKYMDLVWFCLETMATNDFTDKRMYEDRALQIYPGLAHHYAYMMDQGYAKLDFNSRRIFVKMPEMTTRNENLVGWLNELPQKMEGI